MKNLIQYNKFLNETRGIDENLIKEVDNILDNLISKISMKKYTINNENIYEKKFINIFINCNNKEKKSFINNLHYIDSKIYLENKLSEKIVSLFFQIDTPNSIVIIFKINEIYKETNIIKASFMPNFNIINIIYGINPNSNILDLNDNINIKILLNTIKNTIQGKDKSTLYHEYEHLKFFNLNRKIKSPFQEKITFEDYKNGMIYLENNYEYEKILDNSIETILYFTSDEELRAYQYEKFTINKYNSFIKIYKNIYKFILDYLKNLPDIENKEEYKIFLSYKNENIYKNQWETIDIDIKNRFIKYFKYKLPKVKKIINRLYDEK